MTQVLHQLGAVGNRTSGGGLFNAGNQQTEDNTFLSAYDANGNQTKKTHKASGEFTVYTYDPENRLTTVEVFAAGGTVPVATSSYRYDGLGRRIEKIGNGQTRRYVYDGEDILLEYDGSNVLQARYTHGPGIDEPVAMVRGGASYFYHADGLGNVTELTDSSGAMARSYAYDAWGNILEQTGTVENPYAYTGRELDADTGLYYYRARYYDPTTGRFLQKDLIGVRGGQDLYAYALGNPIKLNDPLGLAPGIGVCGSNLLQRLVIPDRYGPYSFEKACQKHDDCYGKECSLTRSECDDKFYINMMEECSKQKGLWAQDCSIAAIVYFGLTSDFGNTAFNEARQNCKACE